MRRRVLNRLLVEMVVKDFQPLSIVDDCGFIRYSHGLDPRYVLPCRATLRKNIFAYYEEAQKSFSELLKTVK